MKNIINAHKDELIIKTAAELEKIAEIKAPEWADLVRTGVSRQRQPTQRNWWQIRTASVLVKIMDKGPIGVSKLRTAYGTKKRRGHKPPEFRRASGNILRKVMQQLEAAELVKQMEVSGHKGRTITSKGISLLDKVAKTIRPKKTAEKQPKTTHKQKKPAETKTGKDPAKDKVRAAKEQEGHKEAKKAAETKEAPKKKPAEKEDASDKTESKEKAGKKESTKAAKKSTEE